jgi:hypothetical protein
MISLFNSTKVLNEIVKEVNVSGDPKKALKLPSNSDVPMGMYLAMHPELKTTAILKMVQSSFLTLYDLGLEELNSVPSGEKDELIINMRDCKRLSLQNYPALATLNRGRNLLTDEFHEDSNVLHSEMVKVIESNLNFSTVSSELYARRLQLNKHPLMSYLDVLNRDMSSSYWGANIYWTYQEISLELTQLSVTAHDVQAAYTDSDGEDYVDTETSWIKMFHRYRRFAASVRKLNRDKSTTPLA